ncbi:M16 family metallopeptidase [Sphingobacterium spiritivorum]|uniref:M16 family metallopeptidase n=1 Tax=Sphingobacterium spiritivorum TaxID=258 RepID=UPI001919AA3B|nr:pitrilysin family protein [Sphingobacterium spiritivorum]QQT27479.1 insulinase family protein [Sphingobacterium spiritivorum]
MTTMEYEIIRLSNGIRIVLYPQQTPITHTCLLINAGSRDEENGKFGVAHFIEHLLFKQTERRNTNQILNRLETVGGDLNAYTTKEYTCIHASILNPYLDRALDLFEDIIFHSTFPDLEMEKEKSVIVDEMASYLDSPEDAIIDDFEDILFADSGLGHNILGIEDQLVGLQKNDILRFMKGNYNTNDIVIGITGDYKKTQIEKLANRIFGQIEKSVIQRDRARVTVHTPQHIRMEKPINQVHYMLGTQAYGIGDERKTGLLLLNNMLGGLGMSSILNLSIREKYGIAYTIESNYSMFSDTGIFSIYLGTDEEKVKKAVSLVFKELNKLKVHGLTATQLQKAKNKFKGQIALAEENRMSMIIAVAKNIMDYDRVITLEEVFQKIDEVSTDGAKEILEDIFDTDKMTSLSFVPSEED